MTRGGLSVALRWLIGALYVVAGHAHIRSPAPFLAITPGWVPWPEAVVFWTGIAELLGALALVQWVSPRLRQAGAMGLALYALCVWPANVNHMLLDMAKPDGGWGMVYHVPRLAAQPLLIWATLLTGGVINWPFGRRTKT
jgi:uncharacterized membrane protein